MIDAPPPNGSLNFSFYLSSLSSTLSSLTPLSPSPLPIYFHSVSLPSFLARPYAILHFFFSACSPLPSPLFHSCFCLSSLLPHTFLSIRSTYYPSLSPNLPSTSSLSIPFLLFSFCISQTHLRIVPSSLSFHSD